MSVVEADSGLFLTEKEQEDILFLTQDELTVRQAANFLGMSEVCVIELLDNDILKYREIGSQLLIKREILLEYEFESREMREAVADITQQSQDLGFYG